jgi:hypothetical protein
MFFSHFPLVSSQVEEAASFFIATPSAAENLVLLMRAAALTVSARTLLESGSCTPHFRKRLQKFHLV